MSVALNTITEANSEPSVSEPSVIAELPAMGDAASGRKWALRDANPRDALGVAQICELEPVIARALAARGVTTENAAAHLSPSLRDALPDPNVLTDMKAATDRVTRAVIDGEGIGVFGDYDVDGVTASAILRLYFRELGVEVPVYLPDRVAEGYGPSVEAFKELKKSGAGVIITVDCGAAAHDAIDAAADEDLDIVVVDHHQMSGPPPVRAAAVVNPNRPDDVSGLGGLSAAGVAFMFAVGLNRRLRSEGYFQSRSEPNLLRLLDLVALGLVCDVMPMTGLTRVLTAQGLKILGAEGNPGLKALGEQAGVKGAPSVYHLGFLLGPRINAAGRIGHAGAALELLTTRDATRRETLAERLHLMNADRQAIEAQVTEDALSKIARDRLDERAVIVVAGENWHPGVVGIVAGRLKEKFDRPTIVIGVENGIGKGSGRSIDGVDLGAAISAARKDGILSTGGGHAMAAGLTVDAENIHALAAALEARLKEAVDTARANRIFLVDAVVAASSVSGALASQIERAGPFGPGNPEPRFALLDMRVGSAKVVGKGHVAATLVSSVGETVRAIAFRAEGEAIGSMLNSGERLHVAGKIRADDWRGCDAAQLQIEDVALAK